MKNNNPLFLPQNSEAEEQYFLTFMLQGKKYAVNIKNVIEVINIPALETPEAPPEGIAGLFNYGGNIIKAVDLCPFLGFKTGAFSINNRMIIINTGSSSDCSALIADAVDNIDIFENDNIQDIPYSAENSILKQIYKSEEGSINIIDCEVLNNLISEKSLKKGSINYAELFPADEKSNQILNLRLEHNISHYNSFSFPAAPETLKQYILFVMDNRNYYMDIKYIKEFVSLKRLSITKLPYTPAYAAGITSIKGRFMLCIDLNRFINPESTHEAGNGKIIAAAGRDFNIAFLVDDIKYIRNLNDIPQSKIYSSRSDYIYAEFMEDGVLYSILDFPQIINDSRLYINIE